MKERYLHRVRCVLVLSILVATAHRLPAPIQEVPESPTQATISPHPSNRKQRLTKPRSTPTEVSPTTVKSLSPSQNPRPYAGIWRGVISCSVWGNIEHRIIVDNAQHTMTISRIGSGLGGANGTSTATVAPEGLTIDLGLGGKWALKPNPDGKTARVHLTGFMLDSSAMFTREQ